MREGGVPALPVPPGPSLSPTVASLHGFSPPVSSREVPLLCGVCWCHTGWDNGHSNEPTLRQRLEG